MNLLELNELLLRLKQNEAKNKDLIQFYEQEKVKLLDKINHKVNELLSTTKE